MKPTLNDFKPFKLGIYKISESQNDFKIFPNPANFNITITSDINIEKIEIFDLLGKNVFMKDKLISNSEIVDISTLQSGIYILKCNENNIQKLINK